MAGKDEKAAEKKLVFITPQEEKRHESVVKFDEAVRLYHDGELRRAAAAFEEVASDYADILEVAAKARQYIKWCRPEEADTGTAAAEVRSRPLADVLRCPDCDGELPIDSSTVSVWCPHCEKYVHCE